MSESTQGGEVSEQIEAQGAPVVQTDDARPETATDPQTSVAEGDAAADGSRKEAAGETENSSASAQENGGAGDGETEGGEIEEGDEEDYEEGRREDEDYDDDEVYKLKSHRRSRSESKNTEPNQASERRRKPKPASNESQSQGRGGRRSRGKSVEPDNEPEEMVEEDEATRERRALEARIDAALQPSSKRRKKLAGDDLEMMQDEAIARLRDKMRHAALEDVESVREGQPAVHKVRMLPEVVQILQQSSLADSILDGNLLESVRIWLEPLPDASLPSFEIQKVLFGALVNLPIKTIHLRESGLGRVVLFYQKSKRPQPSIKRLAQKLIGDWTRPIIGRSDNYRDKRVATADFNPREKLRPSRSGSEGPKTPYEESAARRNRAAIPSASGVSYQVAPVSSAGGPQQQQQQSQSGSKDSQLRRMKTKLMASGRSGRKKSQVSVEGKDLN